MRLGIIGSRTFDRYDVLCHTLRSANKVSLVVSGGAKGADRLAEVWAADKGIPTQIFHADWQQYGKSAGIRRNYDIIDNSDKVVAFWDGKSKGTKHSIDYAKECGKPVLIISDWEPLKDFDWSWNNPIFEKIKPKIPPLVVSE